jgi:hypothetical protein
MNISLSIKNDDGDLLYNILYRDSVHSWLIEKEYEDKIVN